MTRNIAIIPARGGSKGLPGKNITPLLGQPLIAYTIQHCQASSSIDEIYVSTDSVQIAKICKNLGAQIIMRPSELSGDMATSESALIHAFTSIPQPENINTICFLQCTSPIRESDDIDRAYETFAHENSDSLLTVTENHGFIWEQKIGEPPKPLNYDFKKRQRRQDMSPQYRENGSFYIFKPNILNTYKNRLGGKISLHIMKEESAYEIDSLTDFIIIESLMRHAHAHP